MNKLSVANEMAQLDLKNKNFYDELTDTERKEFSAYLCMRYSASVDAPVDLQEWYLRAANEYANKHFFDINKHPKLQWLCCTAVSPNLGKQRHYWQASKKKDTKTNNKTIKFLTKLYPHLKSSDIELLNELNDTATIRTLAKDMGMSDSEIKKEIG